MRRSVVLLATVIALTAAGCGDDTDPRQKPTFPVSGTVRVNGEPAYEARVMLHPVVPFNDDFTPSPTAMAMEDGTFNMNTYAAADGAPAGEYIVTIKWDKGKRPLSRERGPDLLEGKYADSKKSQFRVQVVEGDNTLPPFDLTADKIKMAKLTASLSKKQ